MYNIYISYIYALNKNENETENDCSLMFDEIGKIISENKNLILKNYENYSIRKKILEHINEKNKGHLMKKIKAILKNLESILTKAKTNLSRIYLKK